MIWQRVARLALAAFLALTVIVPPTTLEVTAASGDRTLYLYHTHTKETGRFTFRRNGQYDRKVLGQLNQFLRDWRTNQPTKMDPALFDLIWSVYQDVRASQPVHIVSSYRSPKTNAMLRSKSSAVAENSQHMRGNAMDFFIPGVALPKLREAAMRHQVGGVGYYPTSGSPFVHLDTGNVRAWPRMTRAQLKKVFPDGRTLHLPTDGKPLSQEGRRYAEQQWKQCHTVPCNGRPATQVASAEEPPTPASPKRTLVGLFTGQDAPEALPAVDNSDFGPTQRTVQTVVVNAPVPQPRPDDDGVALASIETPEQIPFGTGSDPLVAGEVDPLAPIPARKSRDLMIATGPSAPLHDGETALVALAAIDAPVPAARTLMSHKPAPADLVTAYVPFTPEPGAERALQMLIERETTASLAPDDLPVPKSRIHAFAPSNAQMAGLQGNSPVNGLRGIFDETWNAVASVGADAPVTQAVLSLAARGPKPEPGVRLVELVAPDLDHVTETLVLPVLVTGAEYSELYQPDEGYFDPTTDLGALATRLSFMPERETPVRYDRFMRGTPLLIASR